MTLQHPKHLVSLMPVLMICLLLNMSSCSVFNHILPEADELKEYALSYTELQLADNTYGAC